MDSRCGRGVTLEEPTEKLNRCELDKQRIERAYVDCCLREQVGELERRIYFEVGYDHRDFPEDCGGGGHGQHGMNLRFVLIGPKGAVTWLLYLMNWVPGNISDLSEVQNEYPISVVPARGPLGDAMTAGLGLHSVVRPSWDDENYLSQQACEYLPDGYCYSDVTYTGAQPLLAAFLDHGPHVVWATLARYYSETFVG